MKKWIALSLLISINTFAAAPVEYVKICSPFGPQYFYDPGTSVCINASTGMTKQNSEFGVLTGQTALALRVLKLETQLRTLEERYGLDLSE